MTNTLPPSLPEHRTMIGFNRDFELDEHQFWQIPQTTLIISPQTPPKRYSLDLAYHVKHILGSAIELADEEMEKNEL
ncbi:hypothetical protein BY458DRAFT_436339 [Sporodiniella umbellata]|nr:hypothetical protein BY458DRAFT_436339 [Sporodiniella umbellata]